MCATALPLKSLVSIVILSVGWGTLHAADFEFETRTVPAPPWNTFQQVRFEMHFHNRGEVPVHVAVQFEDLTRLDRLVDRFEPASDSPAECAISIGPWCSDLSPVPWVFFWCHVTPPVPAGSTLSCSYEVIAFAGADGTRTATVTATPLVMPPAVTPPTYQAVEHSVVFGYAVRQVPTLGPMAILVLIVLAYLAVWRCRPPMSTPDE